MLTKMDCANAAGGGVQPSLAFYCSGAAQAYTKYQYIDISGKDTEISTSITVYSGTQPFIDNDFITVTCGTSKFNVTTKKDIIKITRGFASNVEASQTTVSAGTTEQWDISNLYIVCSAE